jgi:hypothetical protein
MPKGPLRFRDTVGAAFRKLTIWTAATEATVATSPTVTSGSGAPSASEPNGSVYLRTNGAAANTLYMRIGGAWVTVGASVVPSTSVFLSDEVTGNGSAQNTAHGLGTTPALVFAIPSDTTGGAFTVVYGTHTTTNAIVTVTNGEKYRVVAFK